VNYFVMLTFVLWQHVVFCVWVVRCLEWAAYDSHTNTRHTATAPNLTQRSNSLNVLNYNFSKEKYMLPEDDRVIETCRSVLNVLM